MRLLPGDLGLGHLVDGVATVILIQLLYIGLTVPLIFGRARRSRPFAAASIAALAGAVAYCLVQRMLDLRDGPGILFLIFWPALLLLRAGWQLIHRPRELYVPPPEPPPLGGPYR